MTNQSQRILRLTAPPWQYNIENSKTNKQWQTTLRTVAPANQCLSFTFTFAFFCQSSDLGHKLKPYKLIDKLSPFHECNGPTALYPSGAAHPELMDIFSFMFHSVCQWHVLPAGRPMTYLPSAISQKSNRHPTRIGQLNSTRYSSIGTQHV